MLISAFWKCRPIVGKAKTTFILVAKFTYDWARAGDPLRAGDHEAAHQNQETGATVVHPGKVLDLQ